MGTVNDDSPAITAGLQTGDRILAIGDKKILYWEQLQKIVHESPGRPLNIKFERNGNIKHVPISPVTKQITDLFVDKKSVIFGIKGTVLTKDEKDLIKSGKPWGIILFSRNIKNTDQLRDLILSIRDIVKDKQYPIMIDQEGGRVSRLNKLIDLSIFSQSYFAKLYQQDKIWKMICQELNWEFIKSI